MPLAAMSQIAVQRPAVADVESYTFTHSGRA
jgi:hypothetical protein